MGATPEGSVARTVIEAVRLVDELLELDELRGGRVRQAAAFNVRGQDDQPNREVLVEFAEVVVEGRASAWGRLG